MVILDILFKDQIPRLAYTSASSDPGRLSKQSVLFTTLRKSVWKEYCSEYWLKELQESMNRCSGRYDITKILLKTALHTIQLIHH